MNSAYKSLNVLTLKSFFFFLSSPYLLHRRRQWHPTPALLPGKSHDGGPQSMGSLRVRQDSATSLSLLTFMHWRRQWQPTPVFLPGESPGRGSLVGCRLWGRTESDMTEATGKQQQQYLLHSNTLPYSNSILFPKSLK